MLNVRRLRLLRELAHRGTIAAVAEALAFTPSAVSQQLSALEREAGLPLLERTGRRVVLTPAGLTLVRHAEAVLERLEQAAADLAGARDGLAGPLRIGAVPSAGRTIIPAALTALAREHPGLEPMVSEIDPAGVADALRAGELDVAMVHEYDFVAGGIGGGLAAEALCSESMFLASGVIGGLGGSGAKGVARDSRLAGVSGSGLASGLGRSSAAGRSASSFEVAGVAAVSGELGEPGAGGESVGKVGLSQTSRLGVSRAPAGSVAQDATIAEGETGSAAGRGDLSVASDRSSADSEASGLIRQWRDAPWITATPGTMCQEMTVRACQAAGFTPHVRHQVDDFATMLALVAAGQGVALVPQLGVMDPPEGTVLTRVPMCRRTLIAFRSGAGGHPAVAAIIAALRSAVPGELATVPS